MSVRPKGNVCAKGRPWGFLWLLLFIYVFLVFFFFFSEESIRKDGWMERRTVLKYDMFLKVFKTSNAPNKTPDLDMVPRNPAAKKEN